MRMRRFTAVVSLGLVTWCGLAAPPAQAATTTSCASAVENRWPASTVHMSAPCVPDPDQGAPYVFRIGTLYVWRLVGLDVLLVSAGPATATCTAYQVQPDGSLTAAGCRYGD
ncbi:hypothetical protein [Amycolatopsis sp. NPDC004625]|uniref:hypothetical protein n=1 Tax=Amycolatopsis sp. NPDC004625 TaxID=3154670 RepID=UPI0033A9F105